MERVHQTRRSGVASLAFAAFAALGTLGYIAPASAQSWERPYLKPSIWNTPLHPDAANSFVYLGYGAKGNWDFATGPDRTVFLTTTWDDEEVDIYQRFGYYYKGKMYMPRGYTKPDYSGSNQIIVVRQPDGSVVEVQLVITYPEYVNSIKSVVGVIPQIGDNDTVNARQNIFGIGNRYGSHFGSGLPALGGTLRRGELSGSTEINHALNLLLPPEILNRSSGGYRWPATNADEGYENSYLGGNTAARMGCLLALPQTFDVSQLATAEARRVATALKDYGGYCTDGAAGGVFQIAMEESEYQHLRNQFNNSPDDKSTNWYKDQMRILQNLNVVNNNGPDTIGGGYSGPYNGQYRIQNLDRRTQGRVLEVGGGAYGNPGLGTVNLWDWNSNNWQRWTVDGQGNGEWHLNANHSGQSLVAHTNDYNSGQNVGTWNVFDDARFRWYLPSNNDGTYRIQNKAFGGHTLSYYGDYAVGTWYEWFGGDQQRWTFERLCLTAQYWDNANFTGKHYIRKDDTVNFAWGTGSPLPGKIATDTFSARWTGKIIPVYSQAYRFHVRADDGVRLWVNGVQVINRWSNNNTVTETTSGTINLVAGRQYDIKLEYYDNTGSANCQLMWSSPSQAKQIIPDNRTLPY